MNSSLSSLDWDHMLQEAKSLYVEADPGHDFSHILRVCENARKIGEREGADMQVLLLAALFHDAGSGPKSAVHSDESSARSVKIVEEFLARWDISPVVRKKVLYAVEMHGFSRGIVPHTLEARVLQDADRLDAMGAIGIARAFTVGGSMGRKMYNPVDPFCTAREPDDGMWNIDHFYRKLLKLEEGMHTETARMLARRRGAFMRNYLAELLVEIEGEE